MDSPTQGAFGIPTSKTTFVNRKIEIVASNLAIFYQGNLKDDSIKGVFNQNGMPFPLTLVRTENKIQMRPQEPQEPYPYNVEEVVFKNQKESIDLAGTLTIPQEKKRSPAVILIAGSGPNDRDETIFGHKPFWVLADYLSRHGIAVLRYDKRGIGKSGGEYFTATTQGFAEDAEAALNYLKTRKEIDPSKIGLIGHSEGGIIAPMIAAKNKGVSFIVLMAGLGVSGVDLSLAQNQFAFNKTSLSKEDKEHLNEMLNDIYKSVLSWTDYVGTPWFRQFLKTNPSDYLQKVSIPVLAINGENDTQVEYKTNLGLIEAALKKGNNQHYTIKTYPRLNHLFQESTTGEIDEYGNIEQTISPQVLQDITNWIEAQIK